MTRTTLESTISPIDTAIDGLRLIVKMCMDDSGSLDDKVILNQVYDLSDLFRTNKIVQKLLPTIIDIAIVKKKMASETLPHD